jgi:hypothetical protein
VRVPPQGVHGPKIVKTHAQIQGHKFGGNQTILRIKGCKQKDDMMVKLPTNEGSNQKIQKRIK